VVLGLELVLELALLVLGLGQKPLVFALVLGLVQGLGTPAAGNLTV